MPKVHWSSVDCLLHIWTTLRLWKCKPGLTHEDRSLSNSIMWSANQTSNFNSLNHVAAPSEADLPETFQTLTSGIMESPPSVTSRLERSATPHRSVALSSVLLRRIFFAAHKHLILGYFYLLFIVGHGTKGCPGTEKQSHWHGGSTGEPCEQWTARWRQRTSFGRDLVHL